MPADTVRRNQISKKLGYISKTIRFVSVNSRVISLECLFERFLPVAVEIAKALAHKTVESRECALLAATFDDHVDQFDLTLEFQGSKGKYLLTFLDIDLHQFMATFFIIY
jgi:hypothetical protein